jgi:hypothetical protein
MCKITIVLIPAAFAKITARVVFAGSFYATGMIFSAKSNPAGNTGSIPAASADN